MNFLLNLLTTFNNFLTLQVQLLAEYLTSPLLLHFGNSTFVLDFVAVFTDIADCNLIYFILFLVISIKALQNNFSFQVFFTNFFKNYTLFANPLLLLNYSNHFFNAFKNSYFFIVNKLSSFIRKK